MSKKVEKVEKAEETKPTLEERITRLENIVKGALGVSV